MLNNKDNGSDFGNMREFILTCQQKRFGCKGKWFEIGIKIACPHCPKTAYSKFEKLQLDTNRHDTILVYALLATCMTIACPKNLLLHKSPSR